MTGADVIWLNDAVRSPDHLPDVDRTNFALLLRRRNCSRGRLAALAIGLVDCDSLGSLRKDGTRPPTRDTGGRLPRLSRERHS